MEKQEHLKKHQVENDSNISPTDFVLIFITAFAAPLVSHICDLAVGKENNQLSSEKLLCTYFIIIAIHVIFEFFMSYYKNTKIWKKGLRFGNSDALIIVVFFLGASLVIQYYDTLVGTTFISLIFILLILIIWFRPNRIVINSKIMVLFAMITSIIVPSIMLSVIGLKDSYYTELFTWIFLVQIIACVVFDGVKILSLKLKERKKR